MSGLATCTHARAQQTDSSMQTSDTCAIVVAGGSGQRFGDPRGKQFVDLLGLPLMAWSILAFDRAPSVRHVVVVCPRDRVGEVRGQVVDKLELTHGVTLASAGATRQDSVFSGLMAAPEDLGLVAIHDGARPLIEVEDIERCIRIVREDKRVDGAICAARTTDTLKLVDENGCIVATPDRTPYWCAQTPQVFRRSRVLAAHEAALLEGFVGTDDASLVERQGGVVRVVETSRDNLKVTMPEDLAIAKATLRSRLGIS